MQTLLATAAAATGFTRLLAALDAAALSEHLGGAGPFTLFAPTDDAFGRIAPGALAALFDDLPRLRAVVSYHVVPGHVADRDIWAGTLVTLEGSALLAGVDDGRLTVNGTRVMANDIAATNGLIHVVGRLLVPRRISLGAAA
jgi:uncharacterized surface protein with fasciclin (FAS1) repeats